MASYTAYVKLRTGGYQEVADYDNVLEGDQDVYSGYYRDTGWIPQMLSNYEWVDDTPDEYFYGSLPAFATGGDVYPDEQEGVAPRNLTWKESFISFRDASNNVISRFWWRDIVGWSDTAPNEE